MTDREREEWYREYFKQLGYEKRNVGRWIKVLTDTESGFPEERFTCPFCNHDRNEESNYCPECGARLK